MKENYDFHQQCKSSRFRLNPFSSKPPDFTSKTNNISTDRPSSKQTTRIVLSLLFSTLALTACSSGSDDTVASNDYNPDHLAGYTHASSAAQTTGEQNLINALDPAAIDQHLEYLSRYSGEDGTPEIKNDIDYIKGKLTTSGWEVDVKTFYPYMADPQTVNVQLDIVHPITQSLSTKEAKQPWNDGFDKISVGFNEGTPPADITKDVIYANYGRASDYDYLESIGVDVTGKIVLVRYGGPQRSELPYQAYIHHAAGLILYSEPTVDRQGNPIATYPDGPGNPPDGIQRGTVYRWTEYNGDPLTPGYAATQGAPVINVADSSMGKITPTTPIGYGAAKTLLEHMTGPDAPADWQGNLPITYKIGGDSGGTKAHLKIDIDYAQRPSSDIIGRIKGSERPDESIVLDIHYDTWAYGAYDNRSGVAAALDLARVLGELKESGWAPKRTIVLLFTSAEERGIVGSTEWAEWLGQGKMDKIVAQLTMDAGSGSIFYGGAVPALKDVLLDATKQVPWPGTAGSAYDAWGRGGVPSVSVPGGGVDLMVFRDHFGVPIANAAGYSPEGQYRYHCACDDYYSFKKFVDPELKYTTAMTAVNGVLLTRLANADALPLNYSNSANAVVSLLQKFKDSSNGSSINVDRDIDMATQWAEAAVALEEKRNKRLDNGETNFNKLNAAIMNFERLMLSDSGLPGRKWFKHQIYAPQLHNGFSLQVLPGLYDSIQEGFDQNTLIEYEQQLYDSLNAVTQATLTAANS